MKTYPTYLVAWLVLLAVLAIPGAETATASEWLDEYLTTELGYNAQQIEQFRANVAPMPAEQLRAMVRQMKYARQVSPDQQARQMAANWRMKQRFEQARTQAAGAPQRFSPRYLDDSYYGFRKPPVVHHRFNRPVGHFAGYHIWVPLR